MNQNENLQGDKSIRASLMESERGDSQKTTLDSMARPFWFIFSCIVARIIYVVILSLSSHPSPQNPSNQTAFVLIAIIITMIRLVLPVALLVLLLRRRHAFLTVTIIFAVLDGFGLLQLMQSLLSAKIQLESMSVHSYLSTLFSFISIVLAIYVNNSKSFRAYCNRTPSSDRKKLLEDTRSISVQDPQKLIGVRGWLALFAFFLCLLIISTIGITTWFWLQVQAKGGEIDFAVALNCSIFLGAMFYAFPLISLIRLVKKRLDFRNSYVTGVIIDIIMFLIIFVAPDGKIFYPIVPYLLIGVILMIVWGAYLFYSKRVILSCLNGKPDKGTRIDGHTWRKLY